MAAHVLERCEIRANKTKTQPAAVARKPGSAGADDELAQIEDLEQEDLAALLGKEFVDE